MVSEPLRVGNLDDVSAGELGFVPGRTSFAEAKLAFERRQMTGIAVAEYARPQGPSIEVVAADYQSGLHVFQRGVYDHSLSLPTRGLPPYGLALQVAQAGAEDVLLVLYRDPLAREHEPPRLLSFSKVGDRFQLTSETKFSDLVARHGGMTRPKLVGNDLGAGVMLVARDRAGALWDTSYLVKLEQGRIALRPKPMIEALRCSCVADYAYGH